ncbi:MAG: hypothetical protein HFJ17_05535 [Clostridia bacterium]|nr:hypothetical protein [Clostridia bacterium]
MEENKKSLKMPIIILIIILAIALIGGAIYLISNQNNPKKVFTGTINSYLNELSKESKEMKTVNAGLSLGVNINSQNAQIAQVAEYLNKAKITANVQMDYEQEKELVKLGLDYDNENIIDAKLSYKNNDDNAYGYVKDLFDKCFALPIDAESKTQIATIFEESKKLASGNKDSKIATDYLKKSISDRLKDEYFSKEDVKVEVDGKEKQTKKSTLTLTATQLQEVLSGIVEDLKKDEFINCFVEEDRQEVKESLNELESSLNELKTALGESKEATIKLNIYNKGINSEFVKFEIVAAEQDEEYNISVVKNNKEDYVLTVTSKKGEKTEELLNCKITVKDVDDKTTDISVTVNVPDVGEVTVNLQVSYTANEPIEDLDTSNSVNINELSNEDQQKIMSNLQNMKAYKVFMEIYQKFTASMYNY